MTDQKPMKWRRVWKSYPFAIEYGDPPVGQVMPGFGFVGFRAQKLVASHLPGFQEVEDIVRDVEFATAMAAVEGAFAPVSSVAQEDFADLPLFTPGAADD